MGNTEEVKKLALVTGGSRGIGRAICVKLAGMGLNIVFSYRSGEEAAAETERLCREQGADVLAVKMDVQDVSSCDSLVESACEFGGRIDVLVNNAGITRDQLILKMKDEDFDSVIDVNLKGSFYMMRAVSKKMLRQRSGRIINISSIVGLHGNPGQVNYSASKAGIIGMTKSLAKELASRSITVNAIAPGMIDTDMTGSMNEKAVNAVLASIPFARMGRPEDIAGAVGFLAGDDAGYITGQVISVDGGMSI